MRRSATIAVVAVIASQLAGAIADARPLRGRVVVAGGAGGPRASDAGGAGEQSGPHGAGGTTGGVAPKRGVANAVVAFGHARFAVTDANGEFAMEVPDVAGAAWVRVPDGYEPGIAWAPVGRGTARVEIAVRPLDAPVSRPLTIVLMSDTHIAAAQPFSHDLRAVATAAVTALVPPPAFFTILGDATQGGKPAEYALLDAQLAGTGVPFVPVPGNHDWYDGGDAWLAHYGPDNYSFDVGGAHVVVWNMALPEDDIVAFLRGDLERVDRAMPIVALSHAPPSPGVLAALRDLGVAYVLAGHTHASFAADRDGVIELHTEPLLMGGLDDTPGGYRIVTIDAQRRLTARHHTVLDAPVAAILAPAAGTCARAGDPIVVAAAGATRVRAAIDCATPFELAFAGGWDFRGALPALPAIGRAHSLRVEIVGADGAPPVAPVVRESTFVDCRGAAQAATASPSAAGSGAGASQPGDDAADTGAGSSLLGGDAADTGAGSSHAGDDAADTGAGSSLLGGDAARAGSRATDASWPLLGGDAARTGSRATDASWPQLGGDAAHTGSRATDASWPQLGGDAAHTGARAAEVAPPLAQRWVTPIGGHVLASAPPVVGHGLVIAVAADLADGTAGAAVALDLATGAIRWTHPMRAQTHGGAAIAGDLALVPLADGTLVALDLHTGGERWRTALGDDVRTEALQLLGTPTVDDTDRGREIVVTNERRFAALDAATGRLRWEMDPMAAAVAPYDFAATSSVALGAGLAIAAPARELAGVVALDRTSGAEAWRYVGYPSTAVNGSPAIDVARHAVVLVDGADQVTSLDLATGELRWRTQLDRDGFEWGAAIAATPAIARGVVLVPTLYGDLVALDAEAGAELWRAPASAASPLRTTHYRGAGMRGFVASAAITGAIAWSIDTAGELSARALATGALLWKTALGVPVLAGPAVAGDALVIAGFDGSVRLFAPAPPPPPSTVDGTPPPACSAAPPTAGCCSTGGTPDVPAIAALLVVGALARRRRRE